MKLQAGKFYRDRTGRVWGPVRPLASSRVFGRYVWAASSDGVDETFTDDGKIWADDEVSSPGDLVEEHQRLALTAVE